MGVTRVILFLLIVVSYQLLVARASALGSNQTAALPTSNVASEGGSISLPPVSNRTIDQGREHMIPVEHPLPHPSSPIAIISEHMTKVNHSANITKLPSFEVGQKNDNKTSVPKKDAVLTEEHAAVKAKTTSTTTTTDIPHKPIITFGEDEERLPNTKSQLRDPKTQGMSLESATGKSNKTNYVVPIVAVILSVPLVAIIFSVLYKRGADWWQHRHYRRMDFLIEGMYNN